MIDQDFLTSREAAQRARITRQGVARWCARYPDLACRVGGRWRVDPAALDRILRGEAPPPRAGARASLIAAAAAPPQ
jgi:Helix-turn-helix domain